MVKKVLRIIGKVLLWFFGISILSVLIFKWVPVPATPLMLTRAIENGMVCSHDWVPIEEISTNLQKAVIASEDSNFLTHHGFDFKAIEKAMKNNEKGKKAKRRQYDFTADC